MMTIFGLIQLVWPFEEHVQLALKEPYSEERHFWMEFKIANQNTRIKIAVHVHLLKYVERTGKWSEKM